MALMVLITLIHAKPGRILISQLELGLIPLALAALGRGVYARLLDAFPHVLAHVLGLPTHLVLTACFVALLRVAEVVRIQKQTRVLLLFLHEAHW